MLGPKVCGHRMRVKKVAAAFLVTVRHIVLPSSSLFRPSCLALARISNIDTVSILGGFFVAGWFFQAMFPNLTVPKNVGRDVNGLNY